MAQQDQLGSFSSYLQQMQQPIAPKPTGMEGTGMGIANIAMNFLQGLRQGRAQKYMQKEEEEARKEQMLLSAMQNIQKANLLPEVKAQYEAKIQREFAKRVGGVRETSRDTGNPLTDFFKQAGMAIVGGRVPGGKKADLDMNVALEAFAAASDPRLSIKQAVFEANQRMSDEYRRISDIAEANKTPLTDEQVRKNPIISSEHNRITKLSGASASSLPTFLQSTTSAMSPWASQRIYKSQEDSEQKANDFKLLSTPPREDEDPEEYFEARREAAFRQKIPASNFSKSPDDYFKDDKGNVFVGRRYKSGTINFVVDAQTGKIVKIATPASKSDKEEVTPSNLPELIQIAKSQISSAGLDDDIARSFDARIPSLRTKDDFRKFAKDLTDTKIRFIIESNRNDFNSLRLQEDIVKQVGSDLAVRAGRESDVLYKTVKDAKDYIEYEDGAPRENIKKRMAFQISLINAAAKFTDPNSVIRPSEVQVWGDKSALFEKFSKMLNDARTGTKLTLNEAEERELMNLVTDLYSKIQQQSLSRKESFYHLFLRTKATPEQAKILSELETGPVPTTGASPAISPASPVAPRPAASPKPAVPPKSAAAWTTEGFGKK